MNLLSEAFMKPEIKEWWTKHTKVSSIMQDIFFVVFGIFILLIAVLYDSDSLLILLLYGASIILIIYGLLEIFAEIVLRTSLASRSVFGKLLDIRVYARNVKGIMHVSVREYREAKGVSLLFLLLILLVGIMIGLLIKL